MMNLVLNDGSPDLSENQKLVMDLLERKSGP